jgi:tyrosyl-tRNA synthetase
MNFEKEMKLIKKGVEEIISENELIAKLKRSKETGKPLRIKYGIDPTGYDVHIGHLVPIRKMREFQDLGHIGVIIIGDFTAQIGDPTGKDESRPPLSKDEILKNSEKYMEQLYTVLDKDKTEVRWQTEWFGDMKMSDVLKLMGKFTLAQFMAHETFRKRYETGSTLGMHEIMYPILQSYDSVAVKADIELGATEQKFNILAGRDMQKYFDQPQQIAILSPLLMGTDGKEKMSKSLNNYIAVFDPPKEKYGKTMSIPDELIINYFNYATKVAPDEIKKIELQLKNDEINPKIIKQRLAREIVALYHGEKAAELAEEEFNLIFKKKDIPDDIPEFRLSGAMKIIDILTQSKTCQSASEARRMIKQNAVSINGSKISDIFYELDYEAVIKVGKRRFVKLLKEMVHRKQYLISHIMESTGLNKEKANNTYSAIINVFIESLAMGKNVSLQGFGTFKSSTQEMSFQKSRNTRPNMQFISKQNKSLSTTKNKSLATTKNKSLANRKIEFAPSKKLKDSVK